MALTITKRPGEPILIGDDIVITIERVRGQEVRLSISAPPSVRIWREGVNLDRHNPDCEPQNGTATGLRPK